ncbi:RHS repeat-associated core domain-containing protein [Streptomyces flavofungini]|nr:RHS repeat-associated core domain-containing protein [Streptomyces flavofungini]WJV45584.1 RHS repeat-associated core domain-containing protein [Streptomyces flavofungini]
MFGNHKGEPCHADAYKDSWCRQAWRWNLDYVVDPHGDAMAYYWNKETNHYGRDVNGLSALKAYATGNKNETYRTAVGDGWRSTRTVRTFDTYGLPTAESDHGDLAKTGDEQCTTTSYARNTEKNLLTLVKQARTVAVACDRTPSLPADLISVERHYYDGATSLDAAPTKGDVTRLDEQDAKGTGYLTTATHTYDQHGRELTDTDADGNTTTAEYTPKAIEAPKSKTETNALGHTSTTEYEAARGVATAAVDANGKRTDAVHDGLGRVLKVWNPGWPKADHAGQPSATYAYTISRTAANAIATKSLQHDGSYATSYQLYDGLLRERETQAPAIGTRDRVVTETRYDTRGFAHKSYAAYYADGAPSKTLVQGADNKVPAMTENLYDGLGRVTDAVSRKYGDEQWRTKTMYGGDRTTVIPPKGGTATTVVTDARGRTIERLQYTNADRTKSQKTRYAYGKFDEPEKVTDPAGNTWTYTFDARGQQTKADDPDKGLTRTTYDKLGQATSTTDARGVTLTTDYDALGRKRHLRKGGTPLAEWTYDTVAKGQPAAGIRYLDGEKYTSETTGYNDAYEPTSSTVTIPAKAGALAGTYTWAFGYNPYTGQQEWIKHPTVGNLRSERQTTIYGEGNLPQKTTAGSITLVNSTAHDVFSRPVRTNYGALGERVYKTQVYDEHTGRITRQTTDRDKAPQRIDDTKYAYDPAGNVTGITTASGQDEAKSTDTQCFTHDALGQLTKAWTAKKDCAAKPTAATVGGPDAYWQSFAYDVMGNRTEQTDHTSGATTTYTQPKPGTGLPHAVKEATVKGGTDDGHKRTFAYDKAGNTTQRTLSGDRTQNLTWDDKGHLATLTENGKKTAYAYDADGNRLITRDADGTQTLTLPGNNELKIAKNGTKESIRYYTHEGQTVAVRTSTGLSFLLPDHQGTSMAAIAMGTLAITRRKQLPFGGLRSDQSETMPGTRGFVGGTNDPTGLIHLGAREYDPTLGRFLSVDPVIDHDDPAQLNAYSYAHNSPLTKSDPDGLRPLGPTDHGPAGDAWWAADRGMYAGYKYKGNGKWVWKQTPRKGKIFRQRYRAYRANPSHYLIDDSHARARQSAINRAKWQAQARAAEAARKRAEAQRRKKDGILGNIKEGNFGTAWKQTKSGLNDTFGTWDGWKNRVLPAADFTTCLMVSAGTCTLVGLAGASITYGGDWAITGKFDGGGYARTLAWTVGGGAVAGGAARAMGASSWRQAFTGNAVERATVRVPAYRTKLGYGTGPGGGRKGWATQPVGVVDRSRTILNMGVNSQLSWGFCGAGAASAAAGRGC